MDCDDTQNLSRKALRRIIAMLCALALLAERASLRSQAVRWSVLFLLAPGEMVARAYVATVTGNASLTGPIVPLATLRAGDRPDDALRLAQAFRMLAATLAMLLKEISPPSGESNAQLRSATAEAGPRALPAPAPAAARRDSS